MKAALENSFACESTSALHRHENRLFWILMGRRLRRSLSFFKKIKVFSAWCKNKLEGTRLVCQVGPHHRSRIQEEWRRYNHWGGNPPQFN